MILYNESKQNIAKVGKAKKSKKKGVGSIVTFQLFGHHYSSSSSCPGE
jgi:hypothetical protein